MASKVKKKTPSTGSKASRSKAGPSKFGKRLKRVDAERAAARVEDRLAKEKAKARQLILDAQSKAKEAIAQKKRKVRAAAALKKAKQRQASLEKKAAERQAIVEERARVAGEREQVRRAEAQLKAKKKAALARTRAKELAAKAKEKETRALEQARLNAAAQQEKARRLEERTQLKANAHAERLKERAEREQRKASAHAARLTEQAARLAAKEQAAALRQQEKERSAQQLRQAKTLASLELTRLKQELLRQNAEIKAALIQEKRAAKERAQAESEQLKRKTMAEQELLQQLTDFEKAYKKEHGVTLNDLVLSWIRIFSRRPDIHIVTQQQGPALGLAELLEYKDKYPASVLAWYHDVGALEFVWELRSKDKAVEPSADSRTVQNTLRGSLIIPPLHSASTHPTAASQSAASQSAASSKSEALSNPEPTSKSHNVFADHLMDWARQAFIELNGSEGDTNAVTELKEHSARIFEARTRISACLVERGASELEAKALFKALGMSVILLLEAEATEEGARRRRLLEQAQGARASLLEIDSRLVSAMTEGPGVEKSELSSALAAHESFLAAGGGGGTFRVEARWKLPRASYEKSNLPPGQLVVELENLSGHKFNNANLAYSNLCGSRCDEGQFSKADLTSACLRYAELRGAKFQSAELRGCDFTGARLAGADFRKANLSGTNFENADLTGANFAGATTAGTKFGGAIVRGIKY